MRRLLIAACLAAFGVSAARAEGEAAGAFDYYVLALSWSPNWCALTGDARSDDQCDPRHDHSFTLHGLWPQNETGYPSYCRTDARDPSRSDTASMADIMGSGGLAWHQWKKHGRCTGSSARDYFRTSRAAYAAVTVPPVFAALTRDVRLPASVVEQAFLEVNPGLSPGMITITCDAGYVQEARLCMTKDLAFRACAADVARDCTLDNAVMEAVR